MAISISTRDRFNVSNEAKSSIRKPATGSAVGSVKKHGFRRYWAFKSRKRGRPPISPNIRGLIRRMCEANPLWGAPRIHGELLKLGINVSEAAVSKYMCRHRTPPSQTWRTFLENHATDILAIDFLTVPTATFRVLEAIGIDDAPTYLLRDNDAIYGNMFRQKVVALGLIEVTIALRSLNK